MPDFNEDGQLTFDFKDFSDDTRSPGGKSPNAKVRDDMTPGLFDPVVSEEEEMKAFLRKLHSSGSASEESDRPAPVEPDFPFDQTAGPVSKAKKLPEKPRELTRKQLKCAALAFLASLKPDGLALDVPVRGDRCKAGAAAFWMDHAGKVTRTLIAEIRTASESSVETVGDAEQLNLLKLARMEREMLEQEIRRTEPALRDGAMLFSEFEHWNYEQTENPAYQECLRKIRHLTHTIFHGSRLERLQSAGAASECCLIVPDRSADPDTLAEGWGLVYIHDDLSFELIKKPAEQNPVREAGQLRLALNIAAAGLPSVLFAHGVQPGLSGDFRCGPLPRKRPLKHR